MTTPSSSSTERFSLLPTHIAIIPDGNGRWAEKRGLSRQEGHREGIDNMYRMVEYLSEYDVPYLTLYGFSTENWRRPQEEIDGLFSMLTDFMERVTPEIQKKGIRLRHIGNLEDLPPDFRDSIIESVETTRRNTGLNLNIAFNYGGRAEIINAIQRIIDAGIPSKDIDETIFDKYLYTAGIPDVDLLIRTSDEYRLSNFLIWQSSYSEMYFTDVFWPDFGKEDIDKALEFYSRRKRRFGGL